MTHDTGFAPNPYWGHCTLATCKPKIRKGARTGDWVIGTGSVRNVGQGRLIYAMRVDEVLTFDEYDHDSRFQSKKPNWAGPERQRSGDNIYFRDAEGQWQQRKSRHRPKDVARDLSGQNVLVAKEFYYFGRRAIAVPRSFGALTAGGRGHRRNFDASLVARFLRWLQKRRPGISGEPSYFHRRRSTSTSPACNGPMKGPHK